MFDSYLADEAGAAMGFSNTHVYFCAALLVSFSAKIKVSKCNPNAISLKTGTRFSRPDAIHSTSTHRKT
jgi:hypothetical protein